MISFIFQCRVSVGLYFIFGYRQNNKNHAFFFLSLWESCKVTYSAHLRGSKQEMKDKRCKIRIADLRAKCVLMKTGLCFMGSEQNTEYFTCPTSGNYNIDPQIETNQNHPIL